MDLTPVGDPRVYAELTRRVEAARLTGEEEPPPPLPAPEIPWRPATDLELASCRSAKAIVTKATAAGWDARVTFARGPYIGADGQPLDTADALQVVFRWRLAPDAWAIWYRRAGKADQKWELGAAYQLRPTVPLGGNDLSHWLCGTEPKKKEKAA